MSTLTVASPMAALALALLAAGLPAAASAQAAAPDCELHVWPTKQFGAVFHGASAGFGDYGPVITGMSLTPMQYVARRVGEAVDPAAQVDMITALNLPVSERFRGYRLVFHDAPLAPKYGNWIARDVGLGARDSASPSACYAELHVIFITLFRTALSKKIQTGFLYREFGASPTATYKAVDAGSTGAPAFETNGDEKTEEAKVSVRLAFQENLRIFLRKKKMRARP